jgi:hypothetical protein
MSEKLLPCPFCGGKPDLRNAGPGNWWVTCEGCKVSTNDVGRERAIELWNDRDHAPSSGEPDPLETLVAGFAKALLAKLKLSRANGRSGWDATDWEDECRAGLIKHIDKGDPRDVAAYCAFMWHHDWSTWSPSRSAATTKPPPPPPANRRP